MQKYTIRNFERDFPDDAACLEWLREYLYPDGIFCKVCGEVTKHHRVKSRPSYSCDRCGHHEHPMAGTIFQDTRTPLRTWFHAVFLMASTRCGISAKQLEREIGVTYKTAWRMFNRIRSLLSESDGQLGGTVEIDHTYIGGKRRGMGRGYIDNKVAVFGAVERGGEVRTAQVGTVRSTANYRLIRKHVTVSSLIYTDEGWEFAKLRKRGYEHRRIQHDAKVYVQGDIHTNTIEGFWSLVKRGISGVYHSVSRKHLQSYLNEYAFRYSHRSDEQAMFRTMLHQVAKA
jgi:transposase-like protein